MPGGPAAQEIEAAVTWFGEQLFDPNDQRQIFTDKLTKLLEERYEGHWYPDEPHRGCGYRALLSTTTNLDPSLMRAAESTGQRGLYESFVRVFADAGEVACWVNPGEVKILRGRSLSVLYTDGKGSDNPYEKLRVKIEPTRLAVKVDTTGLEVPNTPSSSANGGPDGMDGGGGFGAFRLGGSSNCGSSQGQSPTESPMQSWRTSGNGLPAMQPLPPHMGTANGGFNTSAPAFNQGFGSYGADAGGYGQQQHDGSGLGGGQQRWVQQASSLYRGPGS